MKNAGSLRNAFRLAILAVSVLALSGCARLGLRTVGDAVPGAPPRIVVEENPKDLGRVVSGEPATSTLLVRNAGGSALRVSRIETSCGCTAVGSPGLTVPPGAAAAVDLTVDTRGKAGAVRKTVFLFTNDPVEPVKTVTLRLFVADRGHASTAVDSQSIFEGSCRQCHMDPGRDRHGEALYEASCAMCHRSADDAGYSPGSPRETLRNRSAAELRSAIRDGVAGTSMAAFHRTNGGPLDDSQIDSVVDHLLGER